MKIVLLGSGNVATQLGPALKEAGHQILQVWSRSEANAKILANKLGVGTEVIGQLATVNMNADMYLIAVNDEAIREVAEALSLSIGDRLLVHTSGSTDITLFDGLSSTFGVMWPIQTFSKIKSVDFKRIPIAIEGSSVIVTATLRTIAQSLSEKVVEMSAVQRTFFHIAAVFACNFTNHLYYLADQILQDQHLDFDMLRPLILETAEKVQTNRPIGVQTGPAIRGDQHILDKHLALLKDNLIAFELYRKISECIMQSRDHIQSTR